MTVRELFARLGLQTDSASFARGEAAISGVKRVLLGLGVTLTAGAVYHGLKNLVERTADAAFESAKAARMVGISREAYDELGFAAHESGVHVETLQMGLRYLNIAAARAAKGQGELASVFRTLGVSAKGKPVDELLMDIAAAYERLPKNDPRRVLFARELFGRGGIEMLRMLDQGRAGLAEVRHEAHRLGLVFSNEDEKAALDFRRASLTLHATLLSLQRAIAIPLMRTLAEGKRALTAWLRANRELIRDRVVQFVQGLVRVLQALIQVGHGVVEGLVGIGRGLAAAAERSAAFKGVLIALAAVAAIAFAPVLVAVAAVAMSLEELWGWVTGKRSTLLEDFLGPYDKLKENLSFENFFKIDPSSNPLKLAIEGWINLLLHAKEIAEDLSDIIHGRETRAERQAKLDEGAMRGGFSAAQAGGMKSQWDLAKDPRFTELARKGDMAAIAREFGPGSDWYAAHQQERRATGSPITGMLGVPASWGMKPAEERRQLEERWRRTAQDFHLGTAEAHRYFDEQRWLTAPVPYIRPELAQAASMLGSAAPSSISIGNLVLQGAPTDSPRDFATQFVEQLQIQLGIARAATGG